MRVARPGAQPAERSQVDYASSPFAKMRQSLLREQERPADVGGEDRVPLLEGQACEVYGFVAAGIVDQNIETAEFANNLGDGSANAFGISDITADCKCPDSKLFYCFRGLLGFLGRLQERYCDVGAGLC